MYFLYTFNLIDLIITLYLEIMLCEHKGINVYNLHMVSSCFLHNFFLVYTEAELQPSASEQGVYRGKEAITAG